MSEKIATNLTSHLLETLLKFFYFVSLDENGAAELSRQCLDEISKLKRNPSFELTPAQFVKICTKKWKTKGIKFRNANTEIPSFVRFEIPVDITPWREFQKNAQSDELIALVFCKIIGFSESDVAQGLAATPSNLRYRLGRGFKRLGQIVQPIRIVSLTKETARNL